LEGRVPGCHIVVAGKSPAAATAIGSGRARRHALAEPQHARGDALSSRARPI
jgi:hypothetical protein